MKTKSILLTVAMLLTSLTMTAQTYEQWWKKVEQAREQDLPRTAIAHLEKIETMARQKGDYGHLLKSALLHARLQHEVAPDSLAAAVERLEQQAAKSKDSVLKAVYATVLASVYQNNRDAFDDWQARYDACCRQATAHPELLAAVKAAVYAPLTITGKDSRIFGHDLLSLVGTELEAWQWLNDYYAKSGNRTAACVTALRQLRDKEKRTLTNGMYVARLDSLIALYGDLPECGEVAVERYRAMETDLAYLRREKADWLQQAISRWSSWPGIASLHNSWNDLTAPQFSVNSDKNVVLPHTAQEMDVTIRNLKTLTLRIFRTTLDGESTLDPADEDDYKIIKAGMTEQKEWAQTFTYQTDNEYDLKQAKINVGGLPVGVYLLEFSSEPTTQVARHLYYVTGLRVMSLGLPDDRIRFIVVDAKTGMPTKGAQLKLKFDGGWRKPMTTKTLSCDKNGAVVYQMEKRLQPEQIFAYTADDKNCPAANLYGRYSFYDRKNDAEHLNLFTDRSLYRPGQTVKVAGILWREQSAVDQAAVSGKTVRMELRDANYRVIGEREVLTDRYGKCSAEFSLPKDQLNGHFTIRANNAATSFRVEEYKRPTFRVDFEEHKESYQQGDTVHARAKALTYGGVPVQGAAVKYRVYRRVAFWWLQYSRYWEQGAYGAAAHYDAVMEGETTTADDGSFTVSMPLVLSPQLAGRTMFYHFVAEAEVTDVSGETRSATMTLPLGNKPTTLVSNLPEQVRSDQLPMVTVERRNAAGQPIDGDVRYRIDKGKWKKCAANTPFAMLNSQLKSGEHRMEAICADDTICVKFTVFSLDDKKPVISEGEWFYVSDRCFPADGSPVTIQVGAIRPELHIFYSVFTGNKEIESGRADRKDSELLVKKLSYKNEYGNGVQAVFSWVCDGEPHHYATQISRPLPDKKLRLSWETFRDRLTPGQQEEWRLRVLRPDGSPADASLLAVLYDKSLDQLASHQWHFAPHSYLSLPSTGWQFPYWRGMTMAGEKKFKWLEVPTLSFSRFDHSVFPEYIALIKVGASPMRMYKTRALNSAAEMKAAAPEAVMASNVAGNELYDEAAESDASSVQSAVERPATEEKKQVMLRENLAETAFCYPAIETDSTGQVVIRFTLPESLTTWRFMGITNTADMLYGYIDGEAVASKTVMVQPNVPRFVRMGDQAEVTARIFNQGETAVSGKARLQLTNAANDELVVEQEMDFTAGAGKTAAVAFRIDGSWLTESLLVCKVTASGDGFSDGEQHYLPILSDREMVTRTVPFTQHQPGMKTIDIAKLFPQEKTTGPNLAPFSSKKLTIEYTNNPAWLTVQALPVLGQPWEKSAIELAASYYSNRLALHLMKQNPQVKTVFELWKQESLAGNHTSQSATLSSQLNKNEELKDLLLAETPWVADADRESEQRQRMADFFDSNTIADRLNTTIKKLKDLQNADGSFSWYPGMMPSTNVTVSVAEMLARLKVMSPEPDREMVALQDGAFSFLSKEMVEMVAEMKRQEKKGHKQTFPSFTALRWLYICAIDGRRLETDVKAANNYLIALMKKDAKRQAIYEKALSAIILAKRGEKKTAALYAQSLKEYSVCTEEMGRYYDTRRAAYSWYDYKIPTEVAAIEALQMVTPADRKTVDEMRRWLLQEKRTQSWDTPISTVNAIYAFLNGSGSTLLAAQEPAQLAIDGQPVSGSATAAPVANGQPTGTTAGLGYVKTVVADPQGRTFTATKTSEGTSWGAVYAQFLQKSADVEAAQSGIAVKREIIRAKSAERQSAAAAPLAVGDRITVRITIDASRDLDYVQVVDRRAACMEPVRQLSGYHNGAYCTPKDYATHYYYDRLPKGKHVIETEYYIDRAGLYETGTCTVGCAYAPEYRGIAPSLTLTVGK